MIGRVDDARELFERLLGLRNDLGLLSEEYDPVAGRLVGNFPQAFSHVSLVNSACRLTGQETRPVRYGDRRSRADESYDHTMLRSPAPVEAAGAKRWPVTSRTTVVGPVARSAAPTPRMDGRCGPTAAVARTPAERTSRPTPGRQTSAADEAPLDPEDGSPDGVRGDPAGRACRCEAPAHHRRRACSRSTPCSAVGTG